MKLGNIMIFVNDMTKARGFYSELLGLQILSEEENKFVFALDGCQLVAFKCEKTKEIGDYSNEARTVLVFEVESVEQTFKEMKGKGIQFLHDEPTQGQYAAFVDPFGNVHEIAELSH
ncbi:glyoxalase [Bacillus sp. FJAT-27264]|uniref:VOC family protein n=1 Tax=Paenibacillus sp. (strain DSM 101736 / FJAT-27264) TaxID=1850362 RepID=UPI00080801B4|nr:VOC family protein [Bacillus sp. FJAT-27264]OBZ18577.1 glyoxalase [Bacillus sp. FJAT-27264]